MKKKTIIILSILILIAGGGIAFYLIKKNKQAKPEWATEQPVKRDIQILVTATGTVNPVQSVQVGTQVSGVISKIWVDFNDVVRKNQPIAQIDISNLTVALQEAQANLVKANAQYEQTKAEYDRNVFLLEKKVIPKADYDVALNNFAASRTAVSVAKAEVKKALTNLQYATIKAPIDGVIVSRDVDVGQTVAASFATPRLFVIANNLKNMQLQANVDEADIGQVQIGQPVRFSVDAYPDEIFNGSVKQIRLQPNVVQNVVNYSVIIDAPNRDLKLLPGMNADISIVVSEKKDVLTVPLAALKFTPAVTKRDSTKVQFDSLKHQKVYVLEKDHLKPVIISTGLSDGVYVEVTKGKIDLNSLLVTGNKTKDNNAQQNKGLFQAPRTNTNNRSMRNM